VRAIPAPLPKPHTTCTGCKACIINFALPPRRSAVASISSRHFMSHTSARARLPQTPCTGTPLSSSVPDRRKPIAPHFRFLPRPKRTQFVWPISYSLPVRLANSFGPENGAERSETDCRRQPEGRGRAARVKTENEHTSPQTQFVWRILLPFSVRRPSASRLM
jgi:hypothetical protein